MEALAATEAALGVRTVALPVIAWFLTCTVSTIAGLQYLFRKERNAKDVGHKLRDKYDFIVIGSGSAGAVVASRLSEISSWSVLLLEAGVDETLVSDVPMFTQNLQMSKMDWQYQTEPQPTSCLGMKDGRCNWPRGRTLGGSSVLNAMLYLRGNRKDFDRWEEMGNKGWSYEDVLPYFLKSEDNSNPNYTATRYHGQGGYLSVSDPPYKTALGDAFVQGGVEMGYPSTDCNGAQQTGFMVMQGTVRRGQRCSTAKAFLKPVKDRPNLHIAMNAHVKKINIHYKNKHAESVVVHKDLHERTIRAKKEIILCAGTIGSPHLLMLSGVGPRRDLQGVGVRVVKDLPVGKNLQDHIALGGLTFLTNTTDGFNSRNVLTLANFKKYVVEGAGPLTSKATSEAVGFINTKYADPSGDYPDMELQFSASSVSSDSGLFTYKSHGLTNEFYNKVFRPINGRNSWSVTAMILRPNSRGYIKLASRDPKLKPLIYSNYLTHPQDVKVIREGVKFVLAMANTPALKKFGSRVHNIPYPACAHLEFMSDVYIECAIRQYTMTIYHFSGTCKMGPDNDKTSVVDPKLRVHGIKGLRVIDASIMPNLVSANTHAAAVMIGEKGSDLIKKAHGKL